MMPKSRGFTLIELMIVVAIVAILVGIAMPNYREYVLRSNRAVAKGALLEVASRQEQYFLNNRSYTHLLADLGYPVSYYIDSEGQPEAAAG
ncbi:MAG: type IV pilin protein, partial [Porticoccus sp.]